MKYNNLILKIEKPCNEDFDLMTTNANGKFCNHCSKSVLDLTNLTDDEIFETLNKTKGKICGRLANDQLNRLLVKRNNNIYHTRLYKILAGLLLIGTTKETLATEPNLRSETQFIIENEEKNNQTYSLIKDETTDTLKNVIQGKVIDELTKEPLEYLTINIKNTSTSVATDANGNFKLIIPDSLLSGKITLILMYPGYERREFEFDSTQLPIKKDLLLEARGMSIGAIERVYVKKKWWQKNRKSCP